jgi:hypothetical protein
VQHFLPASQDELPQHVFPASMQNFEPPGPVQQVWPALHEVLPQQNPPEGEQNVEPPVPVQQVWPALHEELPQHTLPAAIQKFPGQQVWPALHAGEQVAARAAVGLSAKMLSIPPASALPNNLRALRRGIGLARMRATSSKRFCMFPVLPVIQFFDTREDEALRLQHRVKPPRPTHRNHHHCNYEPGTF